MKLSAAIPELRESRVARLSMHLLPWLALAIMLLWAWGPRDLFHTLPGYGDTLEHVSGIEWFDEAITHGQNPLVYPLNFYPQGWQIGSHAGGAILFVLLWPLARLAGIPFAINLTTLLCSVLAFRGVQLLARSYLSTLPATLAALAFTFWGLRWSQLGDGRLNILVASTLVPWLAFAAERILHSSPSEISARRHRRAWLVGGGLLWALTIMCTMYFSFIGGLVLAAWFCFAPAGKATGWRDRAIGFGVMCAVALVASSPWLYLNWRANAIADPEFYKITEVSFWGASPNALPLPYLFHPWFGSWARQAYGGLPWENALVNFGPVGLLLALAGIVLAWKERAWRPVIVVVIACLVMSLGLVLQWSSQPVQWAPMQALNKVIWQIGHAVKPSFFAEAEPPTTLAQAVPLPALLLSAVVPLVERGRLFARYALAASLGVYLLAGLALWRLRQPWLRGVLAVLLMVEIWPPQLGAVPFPVEPHPAFTWLSQQNLNGQGIADMTAGHPYTPVLATGGPVLLATRYHHQPTVAGASGVTPRHYAFLANWLATHEHSYWDLDFAPILRSYNVKYILLHMQGEWEQQIWHEAQANKELRPVQCFDASQQDGPWPWPICVLEVLPSLTPGFNVLLHDGWSGMEDWGVWAEGTESHTQWVATARTSYRLSLSVFPQCVPDQKQELTVEVRGTAVATHRWENCDPWDATIEVPADLVQVGANDLVFYSAYAVAPAGAGSSDTRRLSVGFTKLRADPAAQ